MTVTGAVMLGLCGTAFLLWLVWKFLTPPLHSRGYLTVILLALLYVLGMLKLLRN